MEQRLSKGATTVPQWERSFYETFKSDNSLVFHSVTETESICTRTLSPPTTSPIWWSIRDDRLLLWLRVGVVCGAVNKPGERGKKGTKSTLLEKRAAQGTHQEPGATGSISQQNLAGLLMTGVREQGRVRMFQSWSPHTELNTVSIFGIPLYAISLILNGVLYWYGSYLSTWVYSFAIHPFTHTFIQ